MRSVPSGLVVVYLDMTTGTDCVNFFMTCDLAAFSLRHLNQAISIIILRLLLTIIKRQIFPNVQIVLLASLIFPRSTAAVTRR